MKVYSTMEILHRKMREKVQIITFRKSCTKVFKQAKKCYFKKELFRKETFIQPVGDLFFVVFPARSLENPFGRKLIQYTHYDIPIKNPSPGVEFPLNSPNNNWRDYNAKSCLSNSEKQKCKFILFYTSNSRGYIVLLGAKKLKVTRYFYTGLSAELYSQHLK